MGPQDVVSDCAGTRTAPYWGLRTTYGTDMRDIPSPPPSDRVVGTSVLRGWRRRCPNCGAGPMMQNYLEVRDTCPVCQEDLHHHKADDGPAYLTILIVGHVMAPVLLWYFTAFRPEPLQIVAVFSVGTVALSLWLLPRLKGAIVAYQWAKRLYGFG